MSLADIYSPNEDELQSRASLYHVNTTSRYLFQLQYPDTSGDGLMHGISYRTGTAGILGSVSRVFGKIQV
jgi:hypothetical protein